MSFYRGKKEMASRFDITQNYNEFKRIHGFDITDGKDDWVPDTSGPDKRITRSGLEVGLEMQKHRGLQPSVPITRIADAVLNGSLNGKF